MGAEVRQRDHLAALIAKCTIWQTWTGLNEADAADRISWPDYSREFLPACTLIVGSSSRTNRPQQGSDHQNFAASGTITATFFDRYKTAGIEAAGDDELLQLRAEKEEDSRFGGLVTDLVEEMLTLVGDTRQRISVVNLADVPWRRGVVDASHEHQRAEGDEMFSGAFWECPVTFQWGIFG